MWQCNRRDEHFAAQIDGPLQINFERIHLHIYSYVVMGLVS